LKIGALVHLDHVHIKDQFKGQVIGHRFRIQTGKFTGRKTSKTEAQSAQSRSELKMLKIIVAHISVFVEFFVIKRMFNLE